MSEVLVIGGANIDIKAKCINPHMAATSNPAVISHKPGGVARNVAHNLARLGTKVSLLTAVGGDEAGQGLLRATAEAGVDVSLCLTANGTTGTYLAMLNEAGELVTAANDMAVLRAITPALIDSYRDAIISAKFVIADCNLPLPSLKAIAKLAAEKLIVEPVSFSKALKLYELLGASAVFLATPNLDQIAALTLTREPQAASSILRKMGVKNLVIHAGSEGAYVSDQSDFTHVASSATIVIDVTGAGDAATAGLVHGLMQGMPLAKAAELGQEMAARVIASTASTLE